jgi:hypothetical protein
MFMVKGIGFFRPFNLEPFFVILSLSPSFCDCNWDYSLVYHSLGLPSCVWELGDPSWHNLSMKEHSLFVLFVRHIEISQSTCPTPGAIGKLSMSRSALS